MLHGELISQPTYAVLQTLPEGSSGEVRVVWHDVFQREMVQKTISTLGLEDSVSHQEPQLLDRIDHSRIVRIREAQPDPDVPDAVTLVMEYYPEGSVGKALAAGTRFGIRHAIRIATDTLDALDHLHAVHGYLHRDVKPGNILLERAGTRGLLTDLGSAARFDNKGTCEAHGGTLLYRAPEYRSGLVDVRYDLYGVGVTLLEMLAGPLPYADIEPQTAERSLAQGRRAFPERMVAFPPHVGRGVARVIRALLARGADHRPATASRAARLLQDLKSIDWVHVEGDGLDGQWRGSGLPQRRGAVRVHRVTSRVLTRGADRGGRRVELLYRSHESASWRRLVAPVTVASADVEGVRAVFATAHANAFQD